MLTEQNFHIMFQHANICFSGLNNFCSSNSQLGCIFYRLQLITEICVKLSNKLCESIKFSKTNHTELLGPSG